MTPGIQYKDEHPTPEEIISNAVKDPAYLGYNLLLWGYLDHLEYFLYLYYYHNGNLKTRGLIWALKYDFIVTYYDTTDGFSTPPIHPNNIDVIRAILGNNKDERPLKTLI